MNEDNVLGGRDMCRRAVLMAVVIENREGGGDRGHYILGQVDRRMGRLQNLILILEWFLGS